MRDFWLGAEAPQNFLPWSEARCKAKPGSVAGPYFILEGAQRGKRRQVTSESDSAECHLVVKVASCYCSMPPVL